MSWREQKNFWVKSLLNDKAVSVVLIEFQPDKSYCLCSFWGHLNNIHTRILFFFLFSFFLKKPLKTAIVISSTLYFGSPLGQVSWCFYSLSPLSPNCRKKHPVRLYAWQASRNISSLRKEHRNKMKEVFFYSICWWASQVVVPLPVAQTHFSIFFDASALSLRLPTPTSLWGVFSYCWRVVLHTARAYRADPSLQPAFKRRCKN